MAYIYKNGAWTDYEPHKYGVNTVSFTSYPFTLKSKTTPVTATVYGNMQQSGTPTPAAPIYPTETGDKTGNLFDENLIQIGYYGGPGSISVFTIDDRYRAFSMAIKAGTYTIKIQADEDIRLLRIATTNDFYSIQENINEYTFVISADDTMYVSWRNVQTTNSFTNMTVMLNSGSTALPYEPYGYKIPILSGGTTTPVYLGEVQSTRQIKKLVLTGEEIMDTTTITDQLLFRFALGYTADKLIGNATDTLLCNVYKIVNGRNTAALAENNYSMTNYNATGDNRLLVHDDRFTTLDDFKAYLAQQYAAGTPICVWYVLATPTTSIVNEPIRKIGNYSDSVTASIPVIIGSDTVDINTTLKPSAVAAPSLSWGSGEDHKYTGGSWG